MNCRRSNITSNVLLVLGVALGLSLSAFKGFNAWAAVVAVLAFVAITANVIVRAKYYKCPHCRSSLFSVPGPSIPENCPRCGKKIRP